MSWSLVLSSFPQSILKDKWPLLILSIIDRSGLATEEEVAKNLGINLPKAKTNILKLKLNDLIDYGSNHVKLSSKGFQLMERLNLHNDVMDDFLDSLNLSNEERVDFENILKEYKKTSFRLFQNSLCTLRQWRNISRHFPATDVNISNQISNESDAGMRCLLYRDLRNWISHYKPSRRTTESLSERTRLLLFIDNIDDSRLYSETDYTHNCSIDYLRKIKTPSNQHLDIKSDYYLLNIFNDFNNYQSCYEPDIWFDKWAIEVKVPNWKRFKKISNYLDSLNREIVNYTPYKINNISIVSIFQEQWRNTLSGQTSSGNFLEDLFLSKDLIELSERTGVDETTVKMLLERISGACQEMLKETSTKDKIPNTQ